MIKIHKFTDPFIYILGVAQDAGFPSPLCRKKCCLNISLTAYVYATSFALIIPNEPEDEVILFDCTPDFKFQMLKLQAFANFSKISAVFLTHAHIGHCAGLINFGREVLNTSNLNVYCFERMKEFLIKNGHFSQLVQLENIKINTIFDGKPIHINKTIEITPFLVKHRGEFSETCGFQIKGNKNSIVFLPDIDNLNEQNLDFEAMIKKNDKIYIDGTFFNAKEIGDSRNIKEIPHPFIEDSIKYFDKLESIEKNKIFFIHFNHTNACLIESSEEAKLVFEKGYKLAKQFDIIEI